MKKIIKCCDKCNSEDSIYVCDVCGKQDIPFTLSCGYGSDLDGEQYDFCSFQCMLQFIKDELSKQEPQDDRFIFGEKGE